MENIPIQASNIQNAKKASVIIRGTSNVIGRVYCDPYLGRAVLIAILIKLARFCGYDVFK